MYYIKKDNNKAVKTDWFTLKYSQEIYFTETVWDKFNYYIKMLDYKARPDFKLVDNIEICRGSFKHKYKCL